MTLQRQTVVYAVDASFWDHTYVSIYSLLVNNQDVSLDIRILSNDPGEQFFGHVEALRQIHEDAEISLIPVDDALFSAAPLTFSYISHSTYYRLAIDSLLPATVHRVLYLDGDTIIRGSLRELFELDISNVVLAATPEYVPLSEQPPSRSHPTRLGWQEHTPYFNAGMLYINLDMWRELDIQSRSFDYLRANKDNPDAIAYQDQDTLNNVLIGKWHRVGPRFNYEPWAYDSQRLIDPGPKPVIGELNGPDDPLIVHYTGRHKPWHGSSRHPYAADYWHYRMQTPYADRRAKALSRLNGVWKRNVRPITARIVHGLPFGSAVIQKARSRKISTT